MKQWWENVHRQKKTGKDNNFLTKICWSFQNDVMNIYSEVKVKNNDSLVSESKFEL